MRDQQQNEVNARTAVIPLRLIVFGGALCLLDLEYAKIANGEGFRFDLLNDCVGMLMIASGAFQLIGACDRPGYARMMGFVFLVAVFGSLDALHHHFVYDVHPFVVTLSWLIRLALLFAAVLLCVAMRWLNEDAGNEFAARSFKTTTWLFVVIYLIPLGLIYSAGLVMLAFGTPLQARTTSPMVVILVLIVLFTPLIHFVVSTSRMKAEADARFVLGVARGDPDHGITPAHRGSPPPLQE